MSDDAKPVPAVTRETEPFWEGARGGELRYQFCLNCQHPQFYPRIVCARCGSRALEWRPASGLGRVHAVTVVHRPPSAAFRPDTPYVVALVDLDEGFRMMANVLGVAPETVTIGDRVRVTFERRGEVTLPQFVKVVGEPS